ncbi:hypothetical protein A2955_00505 [Candidatus Woesebacteria bacterium RIFCSPLOWO2_01_FULL_37_19]|uniref:dTDP-4-dehydrorhamnose reductase n=1 Tax=Candidatus Woesebacteria bacterium RIFCSPLOWO2_01_FULL_37_19 TaxID=1802514 RepID=A0A1F8B761_9BACT|nr:MAG: hypothetical protein A2955_00505 [Candidatus Woesebacteria bacterium RIFCSPLOWO2_01_FULL_37_19]
MISFVALGGNSRLAKCFSDLFPDISVNVDKSLCDITNKKDIEKVFKKTNAKYILNCAAITDIEYCEKNPKETFDVNTIAPLIIEKLCEKYNKKLIQISSDYAYFPTNVYGISKYLIEKLLNPKKTLIVRTSFYYKDLYLIKGLFKNQSVSAYKNMYFNPISINRAAKEIYKNRNKKGVINIFSSKKISKYHFAMKVCKVFDTDKKLVKPVSFVNKVGFALRPPDSSIDSNIAINLDKDLFQFKKYIKIR